MGIQALPYLARIPPSLAISEGGAVTLGKEEVMPTTGYPWSAEAIAEWVLERSGVAVGEIKRPTLISTRRVYGPEDGARSHPRHDSLAVCCVGSTAQHCTARPEILAA